jgi:hypothetical protein
MKKLIILIPAIFIISCTDNQEKIDQIAQSSCEVGYIKALTRYQEYIPLQMRVDIIINKLYKQECKEELEQLK